MWCHCRQVSAFSLHALNTDLCQLLLTGLPADGILLRETSLTALLGRAGPVPACRDLHTAVRHYILAVAPRECLPQRHTHSAPSPLLLLLRVLNRYEQVRAVCPREQAVREIIEQIRADDRFSDFISICPISKVRRTLPCIELLLARRRYRLCTLSEWINYSNEI